jgi:GDSL-like Lipase/Acylhydrolase
LTGHEENVMKKFGNWVFTAALVWMAAPLTAASFRKYVALGDSLTIGEEAGCVVQRHQKAVFAAIVARQMGFTDFESPLRAEVPPPADGVSFTGQPCLGIVVTGGKVGIGVVSQEGGDLNAALARPFDNLGMNSFFNTKDMVDLKTSHPETHSAKDITVARVLRNFVGGPFEGMSAIDEANALNPDVVTLWIGINDVLLAATSGTAIPGVTLTPQAVFDDAYGRVLSGIQASGRTIVVANIPDILDIPFFTYIPPFIINPATGKPIPDGQGGFLTYLGQKHDGTVAPIPPDTLVLLTAAPLLAQGIGVPAALGGTGLPLPDGGFTPPATLSPGVLLYKDEIDQIEEWTDHFNATIQTDAAASGAAFLDIHAIYGQVHASGYDIGGIHLSADFPAGGLFSADGLHPTNISYAILADYWIQAINAAAGSSVPRPDIYAVLFTPDVPQFTSSAVLNAIHERPVPMGVAPGRGDLP